MGKATGQAIYADDIQLPRMLHAKILRSPHAHARIVSIDFSKALKLPGVVAVLQGSEMPTRYGVIPWTEDEQALVTDKARYVGDEVACLAAVDELTAEEALEAIKVEYEILPNILTVADARAHPEVKIHERSKEGNVSKRVDLAFGDVEGELSRSAVLIDENFYYEGSAHAPIEPHCAIAQVDGDGNLTVWSSTQIPHYLHRALAKVLQMPEKKIRVIQPFLGGAFGGKSEPFSLEFCVAKLALKTGRPVKILYTREEVFYAHRGRHPMRMRYRVGTDRDGKLTAVDAKIDIDGGAYRSFGLVTAYYAGQLLTGPYRFPTYHFDSTRFFTNKPCRPQARPRQRAAPLRLRGLARHGGGEAEARSDRDPAAQLHRRRSPDRQRPARHLQRHRGVPRPGGEGLALEGALRDAPARARSGRRRQHVHQRHGVPDLPERDAAERDPSQGRSHRARHRVQRRLRHRPGLEQRAGVHPGGRAGCLPEDVVAVVSDTDLTPVDMGAYCSRVTFMMGLACIEAAQKLRAKLFAAVAEKWGTQPSNLAAELGTYREIDGQRNMAFVDAVKLAEAKFGTLGSTGSYRTEKLGGDYRGGTIGASPAYSFTAHVAEVTVDEETGVIAVDKLWVAHDCGRALNPCLVEGQMEGCAYMGYAEALFEEQTYTDKGLHKGPNLLDYRIPTTLDMPDMQSLIVESIDPKGPHGAKEAGEGPLHPSIPAISNAVWRAVGIRLTELPFTPARVLRLLKAQREKLAAVAKTGS